MSPDPDPTELWITITVLLAGALTAITMVWLERRPRTDFRPRLVPTTPIMLAAAFIGLLALVHLLNLWGIQTGRGNGP